MSPITGSNRPWSSLPKFITRPRPAWLESAEFLEAAGGLADTTGGWKKYLTYLEFPAEDEPSRQSLWAERLTAFARVAKIDLAKLPAPKSSPEKILLAAALKQTSSVSNAWLATRLAMGEPASASQFVRRHLLTKEGRAATAGLIAQVISRLASHVTWAPPAAVAPQPRPVPLPGNPRPATAAPAQP